MMLRTLYLTDDEIEALLNDILSGDNKYTTASCSAYQKLIDSRNGKNLHYSAPIKATFTGVLKARALAL